MDMGSLTCARICERAVQTYGGSGTNKSAQELTQRDIKNCPSPCPCPVNPGFSDLNPDALTTKLRHPFACMINQFTNVVYTVRSIHTHFFFSSQ